MARAVRVVLALAAQEKSVEPLVLANRVEPVEAAGEELVDIALVADIENKLVPWRVEDAVQCNRQLDHAKIRPQMAAGLGEDANQFLADFLGQVG